MLLTSTETQGGYITTNRTMVVATLSNSDTTELLGQENNGGCYFNQQWDNRAIMTKK